MYRIKIPTLLYPAVITVAASYSNSSAQCRKDRSQEDSNEIVLATGLKMKQYLLNNINSTINTDELRLIKTKSDGTSIYCPKKNYGKFEKNGMSVARVAVVDIKCSQKEIMNWWLQPDKRREWDTTQSVVYPVESVSGYKGSWLTHTVEKPNFPLVPSRDFVLQQFLPSPGALVGSNNYRAQTLVTIDASENLPRSWLYVRGKQNSVLLLEPKGENVTRVTFFIEKEPCGWGWIFSGLEGVAPVSVISDLKKFLERENDENGEKGLSVQEVAKKRIQDKLSKAKKDNVDHLIDDDLKISKEDLKATIKLLEEKLTNLKKTERVEKIDLSELKSRIEHDLKKAKSILSKRT